MREVRAGTVKLCSLQTPEHARWAVGSGADAVGLIFVEGRRRTVSEEAAKAVVAALRQEDGGTTISVVGVFGRWQEDTDEAFAARVNRTAEAVGLDAAQVHHGGGSDYVDLIELPTVVVLSPVEGTTHEHVLLRCEELMDRRRPPVAIGLDSAVAGKVGGTGECSDWTLAAKMAAAVPLVLAGGLTPVNVAQAIGEVRPRAVDVSSGVEKGGVKDVELMAAFVANAREAFRTA